MKQSVEERRLHHQTREDRQRKVYGELQRRIFRAQAVRNHPKLAVYERDLARLGEKLGLSAV